MESTGSVPSSTDTGVWMQHVVISLADGRRGVFMGPMLIKDVEMKLGAVPQLTSVDFEPPRLVNMPIARDVAKQEDIANADTKTSNTESVSSVDPKA